MTKKSISVIILTHNEEKHLVRCITSLTPIAQEIFIVDSFSTDNTISIAKNLGAKIYQNPFINHAQQFQWALDNCPIQSEWTMKMDADEYILPELSLELNTKLNSLPAHITGLKVRCRVIFMDKWIKRGYYPMILMRFWRTKEGYMEQKWMDEHIKLKNGESLLLDNDIVDHNLNNLTWWTNKHNNYALREAISRLDIKYNLLDKSNSIVKSNKAFFLKLPLLFRAFIYFIYRYIFKLGFLDGKQGLIWSVLQGFWYQFLVDSLIIQIEHLAKKKNKTIRQIIEEDFNIKL